MIQKAKVLARRGGSRDSRIADIIEELSRQLGGDLEDGENQDDEI